MLKGETFNSYLHILIGLNPNTSVSDITRDIKANSSKWINEN